MIFNLFKFEKKIYIKDENRELITVMYIYDENVYEELYNNKLKMVEYTYESCNFGKNNIYRLIKNIMDNDNNILKRGYVNNIILNKKYDVNKGHYFVASK
jgi:hypothetical protein